MIRESRPEAALRRSPAENACQLRTEQNGEDRQCQPLVLSRRQFARAIVDGVPATNRASEVDARAITDSGFAISSKCEYNLTAEGTAMSSFATDSEARRSNDLAIYGPPTANCSLASQRGRRMTASTVTSSISSSTPRAPFLTRLKKNADRREGIRSEINGPGESQIN